MGTIRVQEVVIGFKNQSKEINKLVEKGLLKKLCARIYTSNFIDNAEVIIKRNWYHILSAMFPNALLSHRSALERMPTKEGDVFLTYTYTENIKLPGLTIHLIKGHKPLEDDYLFFGDLKVSSLSRAYLENLQASRKNALAQKNLDRITLEEKIELFLRVKEEIALNEVRDRAKVISKKLSMQKEFTILNQIITDILGTGDLKNLNSPIAKARVLGEPIDSSRIQLFESFYGELAMRDYPDFKEKNKSIKSFQNFAFFEGYFSNFIEGTEFTVEEAKQIVQTATPIPARDEDSHDILGTYMIVSNKKELSIVPNNENKFISLLKDRHSVLLNARKAKNPGQFKELNNRAGNTEFVDWKLVTGTLKKGFEWYSLLQHPFAKAAYIMFLISEVHPFLDGNGRIARVMMNAELCAHGFSKIIIPTVYREDYIGSLKKLTKLRDGDAYIRMLLRAWEFSSNIHDEDIHHMEEYLNRCNAFDSPKLGKLTIVKH